MPVARRIGRDGPSLNYSVQLDRDLALQVDTYHRSLQAQGMDGSKAETIRELIRLGLAAIPSDEAFIAARARAWNRTRHWVLKRVADDLTQLKAELERELTPEVLYGSEE